MAKKIGDYNTQEIETIAEKYLNGEFVAPRGKENKLWLDYKKALKKEIRTLKQGIEFFEGKTTAEKLENLLVEMEEQLQWIRSIPTYDIEAYCKYYTLRTKEYDAHLEPEILHMMAKRVADNEASETDKQFVRELFEESNYLDNVLNFRELQTPIELRNWTYMFNNPSEYYPTETPMDTSDLYDHKEHYVYVQSTNVARWGESYWVSVDCENSLYSLPVIKAFKEFDFEVDKFYKIQCTETIRWGNNKRKYVMDIVECSEEDYFEKGLERYARGRCH